MILMLNRTEFVESVLAANMLGAIAVPLNFRLTAAEIAFLVEDCEARVMITEAVLAPVATGVRDIQPLLDTIIVAGGASDDERARLRRPGRRARRSGTSRWTSPTNRPR